ncbi:MAG: M50 family metallopeptidase [Sporolactobacillus sp.]
MIKFLLTHTRVHPLFWLIIAAGVITGHLWETFIAFSIVWIHECGHASMAYLLGWKITEIELLPFGGVAKIEEDQDHPFWQECLVILAGPLQNLWLPALSFALSALPFWGPAEHQLFLNQNSAILLFNLLPIWPLDGGHLFHLILQKYYPFKEAYEKMLRFSAFALMLFSAMIIFLFPYSLNLWLILSFIGLSIYKERRAISVHFLRFLLAVARRKQSFSNKRYLTVQADTPLPAVFSRFYRQSDHFVRIEGTQSSFDGQELLSAFFQGRCPGSTIEDCRIAFY